MNFNELTEHIKKLNDQQQRLHEQRRDQALAKIRELREKNRERERLNK
jgi:hypothetical protein